MKTQVADLGFPSKESHRVIKRTRSDSVRQ